MIRKALIVIAFTGTITECVQDASAFTTLPLHHRNIVKNKVVLPKTNEKEVVLTRSSVLAQESRAQSKVQSSISSNNEYHKVDTIDRNDDKDNEELRVNGAVYNAADVVPTKDPTLWSFRKDLWQLTRPSNFPVIVSLHFLGSHLALQSLSNVGSTMLAWKKLLLCPVWWSTLVCIALVSSTSMLVNDYYDAKLGRDADSSTQLIHERVPLLIMKRFLMYLYGGTLLASTFLPGTATRLAVVSSLILTYLYTTYLKPMTWVKNIVCSTLIAASPLASGATVLALYGFGATHANGIASVIPRSPALWRLVGSLWFSVISREILMDCNDVDNDKSAGVITVPVKYGRAFASRVAFYFTLASALCTTVVPTQEMLSSRIVSKTGVGIKLFMSGPFRRLHFGALGSMQQLKRFYQVARNKGQDPEQITSAVEKGLISALFILLSFV